MGSRLIFFFARVGILEYIEDPTLKGTTMTTLLALVIAPFVVIGLVLIAAEMVGKKKTWNF